MCQKCQKCSHGQGHSHPRNHTHNWIPTHVSLRHSETFPPTAFHACHGHSTTSLRFYVVATSGLPTPFAYGASLDLGSGSDVASSDIPTLLSGLRLSGTIMECDEVKRIRIILPCRICCLPNRNTICASAWCRGLWVLHGDKTRETVNDDLPHMPVRETVSGAPDWVLYRRQEKRHSEKKKQVAHGCRKSGNGAVLPLSIGHDEDSRFF